nr:hypothetical protein [Leuven Picorna-like virus 12]
MFSLPRISFRLGNASINCYKSNNNNAAMANAPVVSKEQYCRLIEVQFTNIRDEINSLRVYPTLPNIEEGIELVAQAESELSHSYYEAARYKTKASIALLSDLDKWDSKDVFGSMLAKNLMKRLRAIAQNGFDNLIKARAPPAYDVSRLRVCANCSFLITLPDVLCRHCELRATLIKKILRKQHSGKELSHYEKQTLAAYLSDSEPECEDEDESTYTQKDEDQLTSEQLGFTSDNI